MTVQKGCTQYCIEELTDCWKITANAGKLNVCYKIPKDVCDSIEKVSDYIQTNELF